MPTDRPNVLLIHTDQQRWDALGANGNDEIDTPNLDRLASEGVNFDRYFVQNPVCMPSRASYLTGRYPSELDIYTNGVQLPTDVRTLPEYLTPYGYHTANLGKLHFLPHANRDHGEPHPSYGFDQVEIADEPGCYPDAYRAWVRERDPDALDAISVGLPPAAHEWPDDVGADDINHPEHRFPKRPVPFEADADLTHTSYVADRTIDTLETRADDEPFALVSGFYSPHSPWVVPQRFLDRYDPDDLTIPAYPPELEERREELAEETTGEDPTRATYSEAELQRAWHGYYAMVSEVDHHVGRILDRLEELGLAEDTIVVFTSDHGEFLGEGLRYGKSWPAPDSVSRVPFVVRWPDGVTDPGRTVHDVVEAVDLLPTLLECAGLPAPYDLQGSSLRPALTDHGAEVGRGSALLEDFNGKALRTDRYRYLFGADGEEELYDVQEDPEQYHDISEEAPDVLADHRRRLLQRLTTTDLESERDRDWAY
jgi:arylsulfatase A-like enzyme